MTLAVVLASFRTRFSFAMVTISDGHGGTIVHDPAVPGGVQPLITVPHT
jgi:hypothetical protein